MKRNIFFKNPAFFSLFLNSEIVSEVILSNSIIKTFIIFNLFVFTLETRKKLHSSPAKNSSSNKI